MEHQNNEKVRKVLIGTMSNFQSNHVSLVLVTSVRLFQVQMPSHKGPPAAHVSHIVPKNLPKTPCSEPHCVGRGPGRPQKRRVASGTFPPQRVLMTSTYVQVVKSLIFVRIKSYRVFFFFNCSARFSVPR